MQRDVEEVPGAAGRIENGHRAKAVEEGLPWAERIVLRASTPRSRGSRLVPCGQEGFDLRLHGLKLLAERSNHDRIDQDFDRQPVRVVGSKLRPLTGIEPSFEERSEDGR